MPPSYGVSIHSVKRRQAVDVPGVAVPPDGQPALGGVHQPRGQVAYVDDLSRHAGPALVDVAVNPDEPPLPGKVGYEQAKKFAEAWLHGQPRKASIAATLFKDKIQQLKG